MKKIRCIVCLITLLVLSEVAYADAGLPMIILVMPSMVVLLIPIILIEAHVLMRSLKIKYSRAFLGAGVGNVLSTLIGVPITWAIMLGLELITAGDTAHGIQTLAQKLLAVTLQAAWLIPYEEQFYWMVPAAMAFLMIPFFFISWLIEGFFVKIMIEKSLRAKAYRASFYANLASYAFLELCILIFLLKNIVQQA